MSTLNIYIALEGNIFVKAFYKIDVCIYTIFVAIPLKNIGTHLCVICTGLGCTNYYLLLVKLI